MCLKTVSKDFCAYISKYITVSILYVLNLNVHFFQADPYSKWAILNLKDGDLPVCDAFPHFLADSHHQVCILAAKSITR